MSRKICGCECGASVVTQFCPQCGRPHKEMAVDDKKKFRNWWHDGLAEYIRMIDENLKKD